MTWRGCVLLWSAMGIVACGGYSDEASGPPSDVDRETEDVRISGTLQHEDGTPLAGLEFSVEIEQTAYEEAGQRGCNDVGGSVACEPTRLLRTDATGQFTLVVSGTDVSDLSSKSRRFTLQAYGFQGASLRAMFYVTSTSTRLPTLRVWETPPSIDDDGKRVRFEVPDLDERSVGRVRDPVMTFATADGMAWSQPVTTGTELDARIFEDFRGTFSFTTRTERAGVDLVLSPRSVAFIGSAGAPLSRGKACSLASSSGPVEVPSCAVTDGNMGTHFTPIALDSDGNGNEWIAVDLGSVQRVETVVVRGLEREADIQVSFDGHLWFSADVSHSVEGQARVKLPNLVHARHVRLLANSWSHITSLVEFSVW